MAKKESPLQVWPESHKMVVLSTAHLTSSDLMTLDPDTTPHLIAETKHAFIFYVPEEIDTSLPAHVAAILRRARRDNIAYVMFDGDGPTSTRFKTFKHA